MIGLGSQWLISELNILWRSGRKNSPLVLELVLLVQSSMPLLEEDYYLNVTDQIYQALDLLK